MLPIALIATAVTAARPELSSSIARLPIPIPQTITSDTSRIPTTRIGLSRTSGAIIFGHGHSGFFIDDKDRSRLDLTIDGVTMILRKV